MTSAAQALSKEMTIDGTVTPTSNVVPMPVAPTPMTPMAKMTLDNERLFHSFQTK